MFRARNLPAYLGRFERRANPVRLPNAKGSVGKGSLKLSRDMKIMAIVGTRPEIIKLSRIISEIERFHKLVIVHTGQNYDYELNEVFFADLEIRRPDHFLNAGAATPAETIGLVIARIDPILAAEQPDAVLLYGDTNSCLAVIPAKRRKIPIFHFEAGNRCFDQRVPEEINRKIVDHLSDINMPLTEHARRYLLAEGLRPETVIKIGSPMKEILNYYRAKIDASDVLSRLSLKEREYFVVSAHREENVDSSENFNDLLNTLEGMAQEFGRRIIVSTHPRTRKKLESYGRRITDRRIEFLKPLGFLDYVKLQLDSHCVISDSGTITEESSILNFPAVMIRQAHERPEGMDEGVLIMSGLRRSDVIDAIKTVTTQWDPSGQSFRTVSDYDVSNVSKKVVRIVMSYVDYINRTVWNKRHSSSSGVGSAGK
jgi:UDP-N-acetylglucosamine 2-epimerase